MKSGRKMFFIQFVIISLICVNSVPFSFAQNGKVDSLLALIKTEKEDTNKVNDFNLLSREYKSLGNFHTAFIFNKQAITLAEKLSASPAEAIAKAGKKGLATSFSTCGLIYSAQSNYPAALKNHSLALKIREEIGDERGRAASYNNIGFIYFNQGNYSEALKNHFSSLRIKELLGDKSGMAASYNNIGIIYYNQSNYPEALKNHLASLKIREAMKDKDGTATSFNNIGAIYYNQRNYQLALKNYTAAFKIREEIGDKKGMAGSYSNIGLIYNYQSNYPAASKNFLASLKLEEMIGDKNGMAGSFLNLGTLHTILKKPRQAQNYLNKALTMSREIGSKDLIRDSYLCLTILDSTTGNYKSQIINYKLFILYRDSIDNEDTRKKTVQSQMNYDFEKKEAVAKAEHKKELESQKLISEEKNRKQKIIMFSVAGCLLIVICFAGFALRSLRITRKQKQFIEIQKNEVIKQKEKVEEKQKEILDSIYYARRIQRALITNEKYIEKKLTLLREHSG
ncbi:MAG: tetratricopeptide repeat protein [Bacteroidia bacterium]|nr:tetratricopeptide repeat protein [Bacteroidia bacterium]